jgi:hypothetical protein
MRRLLVAMFLTGLFADPAPGQFAAPVPPTSALPPAAPAAGQASPFPLEMTIIDPKGVEVRSGPTMEYYPTSRLRYGEKVVVLHESKVQPGWYAIKPPAGSFSWIDGKFVKPVDARTGYVEAEGNQPVAVLPGSSIVNKEPNHQSTQIASGFLVTLLDRAMEVKDRKWYPIAPPPSEVRFIPKEAVQAPPAASVTPPNWTKPAASAAAQVQPAPWTAPAQGNATVGTPASFSQPASQWTQYNGVTAQPPQWSQWGKLRRTAFDKDGQPMYVLEDRQGRPLMYVTTTAGTSLRSYLDQTVCLYGAISYRSDSSQRTYYMVASHVATP